MGGKITSKSLKFLKLLSDHFTYNFHYMIQGPVKINISNTLTKTIILKIVKVTTFGIIMTKVVVIIMLI